MVEPFGFIVTRHVNSETTNQYWMECCQCIRRFYIDKIIIIDDNSDLLYLTNDHEQYGNIEVIISEYPQRGEILAYYYLFKRHPFHRAIILHDSVFIQKYVEFSIYTHPVHFLWDFQHTWDNPTRELALLQNIYKDPIPNDFLQFYSNKELWSGCYGVQCIIDYAFLCSLEEKYNLFECLYWVKTREDRMDMERIFGCICGYEMQHFHTDIVTNEHTVSVFRNIFEYTYEATGNNKYYHYYYDEYLNDKQTGDFHGKPFIKIWTGR